MVFLKEFFEKFDFEKIQQSSKNMQYYPVGKVLISCLIFLQIINKVEDKPKELTDEERAERQVYQFIT